MGAEDLTMSECVKARIDPKVGPCFEAMRAVAREEARAALSRLARLPSWIPPRPEESLATLDAAAMALVKRMLEERLPGDLVGDWRDDWRETPPPDGVFQALRAYEQNARAPQRLVNATALRCASLLDQIAVRALLGGPDKRALVESPFRARETLDFLTRHVPSLPAFERLLESISLLRQLLDVGFQFDDHCVGDELAYVSVTHAYEALVALTCPELEQPAARALAQNSLLIVGRTTEERERVAYAIHQRHLRFGQGHDPYGTLPRYLCIGKGEGKVSIFRARGNSFIEAEDLYAMSEDEQAEVRRLMLITPPQLILFGAPNLDSFMQEVPRRVRARILTYLFMDGQEPLELDREDVFLPPPPPNVLPWQRTR